MGNVDTDEHQQALEGDWGKGEADTCLCPVPRAVWLGTLLPLEMGEGRCHPHHSQIHSVCSKEFPAQTSLCAFSLTHVLAVCKDIRASSV